MARARNIKPSFFSNEQLAHCSPWARLCFVGLWCLADREGRLEYRPTRIKMQLFPGDSIDVEPLLEELEQQDLILRYRVGTLDLVQVLAFLKHQHPHFKEPPSELPAPLNDTEAPGSSPIQRQQAQGSPPIESTSSPGQAQGSPPIERGVNPPVERGVNPADPGSRIPDSGFRGSTPARVPAREAVGAERKPSGKPQAREPAWRAEERRRMAQAAPAAVAGDIDAVFAPFGSGPEDEDDADATTGGDRAEPDERRASVAHAAPRGGARR
jgi:hypothetical protein